MPALSCWHWQRTWKAEIGRFGLIHGRIEIKLPGILAGGVNGKYTADDIERFRAKAYLLKFEVSQTYYTRPLEEMVEICNGVGGKGNFLNPVLNFVYSNYQASSTGHDEEYFVGGNGKDRLKADRHFKGNMLKEWKRKTTGFQSDSAKGEGGKTFDYWSI